MSLPTYMLGWQAGWSCGRSGACCTAGWPIPVEPDVQDRLRVALRRGALASPHERGRLLERIADPAGAPATVLGRSASGACLFFDAARERACSIHRDLGPGALPVACRLFPRVCVLEPHGVSIALSHFCPTVAARLLDARLPQGILADPPGFPRQALYEGLDARAALPPLLRPDVLLGWQGQRAFERHAVEVLTHEGGPVEQTLLRLAARVERARAWRLERGPLDDWLATSLARPAEDEPVPAWARADPRELLPALLASLVLPAGSLVEGLEQAAPPPGWEDWQVPLRRFLAAHAFASWLAHQGRGLRTRVLALLGVLALVRARAGVLCAQGSTPLDAARLLRAVRDSDLLLRHLAAPDELARRLARVEDRA